MSDFKDIKFRVDRQLEQEQKMTGLSVAELKRRLAEDWGYAQGDEDE